jgi:hypothetical protein
MAEFASFHLSEPNYTYLTEGHDVITVIHQPNLKIGQTLIANNYEHGMMKSTRVIIVDRINETMFHISKTLL